MSSAPMSLVNINQTHQIHVIVQIMKKETDSQN